MLREGWLQRQFERAEAEVRTWPEWFVRAYGCTMRVTKTYCDVCDKEHGGTYRIFFDGDIPHRWPPSRQTIDVCPLCITANRLKLEVHGVSVTELIPYTEVSITKILEQSNGKEEDQRIAEESGQA